MIQSHCVYFTTGYHPVSKLANINLTPCAQSVTLGDMNNMGREMTERIAVSEPTKNRVHEFREGAGLTYDEALNLMLDVLSNYGEDDLGQVAALLNYAQKAGKKVTKPAIID